jgi:hypothetical protein
MIRGSPEEVLLERQREAVDRGDGDATAGTDDILSAEMAMYPRYECAFG